MNGPESRAVTPPASPARRHIRRSPRPCRRPGTAASGGATRAQPASLWICASVDLTPETSALPSNSLRIVTAASSAAVSPDAQAVLAEIGVEVRGRRDAAREDAGARLDQAGLGRGEHVEALRHACGLARVSHVAGGILQADDAAFVRVEQPREQLDVPGQAGLRREVIEIDRDRLFARSPSRSCRYRRQARRPARPCNRTAAGSARPRSRAPPHGASARPRRRLRPRRCRPSAGRAAGRRPCRPTSPPCAARARTRSPRRWCRARSARRSRCRAGSARAWWSAPRPARRSRRPAVATAAMTPVSLLLGMRIIR